MAYGEFRADQYTKGLWLFNGNANDISGNGNHGTLQNGASFNNFGRFGHCLALDGNNDYVSIPDDPSLNLTDDLTIEIWPYLSGGSAGGPDILTKGAYNQAYSIWAYQNEFNVGVNGNEYPMGNNNTSDPSRYQYLAFTKNGTNGTFYIDGEEIRSFTVPSTINTTNSALTFGTPEYPVGGYYDSVRISTIARSAKAIRQYYALTKGLYGVI